MSASKAEFKKGQRFQVSTAFVGHVLTQWKAPFTGGYEKTLPAGLRFTVHLDPPSSATAVSVDVDCSPDWESVLVDAQDRENPKYNGHYLVIPFEHVAAYCQPLD